MIFRHAQLKSIRDDIIKSNIVISFEVDRSKETLQICEELRVYAPDQSNVQALSISITPQQLPMFTVKDD
ncbi:hypothetical protein ACFLXB_09195 [Chloroflexota bacterium]